MTPESRPRMGRGDPRAGALLAFVIERWEKLVSPGLHILLAAVDDGTSDEEEAQEERVIVARWMDSLEDFRMDLWGEQRVSGLTTADLRAQVSLDAALAEGVAAAKMALSALTASAGGRLHFRERAERIRQEADRMFDRVPVVGAAGHDDASGSSDVAGPDDASGPRPGGLESR